jgi:NADH:ubiquinone oxidoreductase subunit F (NADH-binding)
MSKAITTSRPVNALRSQAIGGIGKVVGNVTSQVRELIISEALMHLDSCGECRICRITAKNLRLPEAVVEGVLVASCAEFRSRLAALEVGLRGAVEISHEAGRAVWAEMRGAA